MTLAFLTLLFVAGLLAWLADLPTWDTPLLIAGVVVAGAGSGIMLGAWFG